MVGTIMRTPSALNGCAKSKYEVLHVHDGMARVRPLGMDQELHISVDKLLTVVPAIGGRVRVLKGRCAGSIGKVVELDVRTQKLRVSLENGQDTQESEEKFTFHEVSKLFENSSTD
mmetsp:Transcript_8070/g.29903  ORF Transcript_8070/g.29903 Transcript_8070/m.29903 type:complete len:116 (+) Transcript_8070:975-1322(+)